MKKPKEIHVHLEYDNEYINLETFGNVKIKTTFMETKRSIERAEEIIHTTQINFLNFNYAERLFIHYNNTSYELTLGDCVGTDKDIRLAHNLEKMLIAGSFSFFEDGHITFQE